MELLPSLKGKGRKQTVLEAVRKDQSVHGLKPCRSGSLPMEIAFVLELDLRPFAVLAIQAVVAGRKERKERDARTARQVGGACRSIDP